MINNSNIIHVLDKLSKREKKCNRHEKVMFVSYYEKLKNIFIDSKDNYFAQNMILNSFFYKLKKEEFVLDTIISDHIFLSVLTSYNDFKNNFTKQFPEEIKHIEDQFSSFFDINQIENKEELFSYALTESLIEYNSSKKRHLSKVEVDNNFILSTKLHEDFLSAKKESDILELLNDKDCGFYIFYVPYQKIVSTTLNLSGVALISKQVDGITIFDFHSKVTGRFGLQNNSFSLNNMINKEHDFNFQRKELKDLSTELSVFNEQHESDFSRCSLLNKIILKCFISVASESENYNKVKNENKAIAYIQEQNNEKTLYPVVQEFQKDDTPFLDHKDLEFKGKYACLSIFDKALSEFYDFNLINFKSKNQDCFHDLDFNQFYRKEIKGLKSLNFENVNSLFSVDKIKAGSGYVGMAKSNTHLTTISDLILGNKEDVYKKCLESSKMNKLTLLNFYRSVYNQFHNEKLKEEFLDFFINNFDKIIQDKKAFSMIKTIGVFGNSQSNRHGVDSHSDTIFISKQHNSFDKFENEKIMDYKNKNNASKLVSIRIQDYNLIEYFISEYGLSLSEHSLNIFKMHKALIKLDEMYDKIDTPNKKRDNFFGFIDNGIDIELNAWYRVSYFLDIGIPMTNKQFNTLEKTTIEAHNGKEIIQKCSISRSERLYGKD